MRTNILLAVDVAPGDPLRHVTAAVDMAMGLVRNRSEQVIVLHVQEFSIPRRPNMADHGGTSGQRAVDAIVSGLRAPASTPSGLSARPISAMRRGRSSTRQTNSTRA